MHDVSSGKINRDQLEQRLDVRATSDIVAVGAGLVIDAAVEVFGVDGAIGAIRTLFKGAQKLQSEKIPKVFESSKFERAVSEGEIKAAKSNNLLRGGREGENFFSKRGTISNDAKRAQQRLGLDRHL